jgi:hypothetical protein
MLLGKKFFISHHCKRFLIFVYMFKYLLHQLTSCLFDDDQKAQIK